MLVIIILAQTLNTTLDSCQLQYSSSHFIGLLCLAFSLNSIYTYFVTLHCIMYIFVKTVYSNFLYLLQQVKLGTVIADDYKYKFFIELVVDFVCPEN